MNNDSLIEEAWCWILKPAEEAAGRGAATRLPTCQGFSLAFSICQAEGRLVPCAFERRSPTFVSHSEGFCSAWTRPNTPPHVNNPRVCEKWAGLWKLHIHCSCGPADSWRRAEDLCSLSPHPTPPPPALPPPFFYVSMKQTCNFHSCVPAVSQGGRQREDEERGAGWCHLENYRLQHSFANPEY